MNDGLPDLTPGFDHLDLETRKLLRETHTETDDNSDRIRKLEDRLAHLSLVTEALWSLLNKRTKLTNDDLETSIQNVLQNRKAREETRLSCTKCNMQNSINHKRCMYCGGELAGHVPRNLFNF